jgi:hypothetical protein
MVEVEKLEGGAICFKKRHSSKNFSQAARDAPGRLA